MSEPAAPPAKPGKPGLLANRNVVYGAAGAGALVLLVALLVWRPWQPSPPRLNAEPYRIAKFAASSSMDRLAWGQQREYMDILADKDDALLAAYKDGRLTDQEYRRALQLGWYDKHLDRMEKFYERPPQRRQEYIDSKVLGKKIKAAAAAGAPGSKKPKDEEKSDDMTALKPEEVDRDNSTEEQDIKRWPADVRLKWTEYRAAVANRKEFYKDRERQAKEAAEAKKNNPKTNTPAPASSDGQSQPQPAPPPGAQEQSAASTTNGADSTR